MSSLILQQFSDLRAHALDGFGLKHSFFERNGGASQAPYRSFNCAYKTEDPNAPKNRESLFSALELTESTTRILNPCHGDKIAILSDSDWATSGSHSVLIGTDAALTRTPNTYFIMSTADCLPILLTDVQHRFAGIVHLGWRNIVAGFMVKVLESIKQNFQIDPTDLKVGIGPSIYPCCYIYDNPIQKEDPFWMPFLKRLDADRYAIDLISPVRAQLLSAGVNQSNILEARLCTSCHNDIFFSCYLEGQKSGRFPSVIGLLPI